MSRFGVDLNSSRLDLSEAIVNFSAGGNSTIIPGISGQVVRIWKYFIVATGITIDDGSTALTGVLGLAANGSLIFPFDSKPWHTLAAGDAFVINSSNAVQVSGRCYYTQEQA